MRPPPSHLPPADSKKWHNRRWIDHLGYLRVRSLANPAWHRDGRWLAHILAADRDRAPVGLQPLFDQAIAAATRYPKTAAGNDDTEASWDALLAAFDRLLIEQEAGRQQRRLRN